MKYLVLFENFSDIFPLSEKQFYKKYIAIHKDIRTKGGSKNSILKNGFHEGVNVNALPFNKSFDYMNKIYPNSPFNKFAPKKGDFIWLLTKEGVTEGSNGYKTVEGYIPNECDGFFIIDDEKSTYENYLLGCKKP